MPAEVQQRGYPASSDKVFWGKAAGLVLPHLPATVSRLKTWAKYSEPLKAYVRANGGRLTLVQNILAWGEGHGLIVARRPSDGGPTVFHRADKAPPPEPPAPEPDLPEADDDEDDAAYEVKVVKRDGAPLLRGAAVRGAKPIFPELDEPEPDDDEPETKSPLNPERPGRPAPPTGALIPKRPARLDDPFAAPMSDEMPAGVVLGTPTITVRAAPTTPPPAPKSYPNHWRGQLKVRRRSTEMSDEPSAPVKRAAPPPVEEAAVALDLETLTGSLIGLGWRAKHANKCAAAALAKNPTSAEEALRLALAAAVPPRATVTLRAPAPPPPAKKKVAKVKAPVARRRSPVRDARQRLLETMASQPGREWRNDELAAFTGQTVKQVSMCVSE